jgi:deoxyribose-phosphate aldolase
MGQSGVEQFLTKETKMLDDGRKNKGMALDEAVFRDARVNLSAVERRAASIAARRSVKKAHQAAWLLRAVGLIDLTTLAGNDTVNRVKRLCGKAKMALDPVIQAQLGLTKPVQTAAVCVYPSMVETAAEGLAGTGIGVASVATGFPAGQIPLDLKLAEIRYAVASGATEIDIVITRSLVFAQDWARLYDEISQMKEACGKAHLKTILATGDIASLRNVYRASMVAMMAGADFIKTSTGKEAVNAVLPVGLTMVRAIREYNALTGAQVGFKPAGGISTAKDALTWMSMMREELGPEYLTPHLFRFGASSLLTDIERQLEHHATGRYSAAHHHAIS